jgi:hypothetical protein
MITASYPKFSDHHRLLSFWSCFAFDVVNETVKLVLLCIDFKSAVQLMKTADIAAIAALFKLYFRQLPEPLFTYNFYQEFVNAMSE